MTARALYSVAFIGLLLISFSSLAGETLRFLATGDVPYSRAALYDYQFLLTQAKSERIAFLVHVGDLKGGSAPCDDEHYTRMERLFRAQPWPVAFTPGDNDWTDCHRAKAGGHDQLRKLAELRRRFYADDGVLRLSRLNIIRDDPPFVENYRFVRGGVMFLALHLVGSDNNRVSENPRAMAEFQARDRAVRRFMAAGFSEARQSDLAGMVLLFHANPLFERNPPHPGYREFLADLAKMVQDFHKPVLGIHGDSHYFQTDQPLRLPGSEASLPNFTRLEVPGAPAVAGVMVSVRDDSERVFHLAYVDLAE